jgi:hypothetical protein
MMFVMCGVVVGREFLHITLSPGRLNEKRAGWSLALFHDLLLSYLLDLSSLSLGVLAFALSRLGNWTSLLGRRGDVSLVLGCALGRSGLRSCLGGAGAHAAHKSLHLPCRVNDALLARVKGVAIAAQVRLDYILCGHGLPGMAARARHGCEPVLGVYTGFHFLFYLSF